MTFWTVLRSCWDLLAGCNDPNNLRPLQFPYLAAVTTNVLAIRDRYLYVTNSGDAGKGEERASWLEPQLGAHKLKKKSNPRGAVQKLSRSNGAESALAPQDLGWHGGGRGRKSGAASRGAAVLSRRHAGAFECAGRGHGPRGGPSLGADARRVRAEHATTAPHACRSTAPAATLRGDHLSLLPWRVRAARAVGLPLRRSARAALTAVCILAPQASAAPTAIGAADCQHRGGARAVIDMPRVSQLTV